MKAQVVNAPRARSIQPDSQNTQIGIGFEELQRLFAESTRKNRIFEAEISRLENENKALCFHYEAVIENLKSQMELDRQTEQLDLRKSEKSGRVRGLAHSIRNLVTSEKPAVDSKVSDDQVDFRTRIERIRSKIDAQLENVHPNQTRPPKQG